MHDITVNHYQRQLLSCTTASHNTNAKASYLTLTCVCLICLISGITLGRLTLLKITAWWQLEQVYTGWMAVMLPNKQCWSTHTRLTALFPGLPGWAGTRKVKPIWVLLKQETVSGSGISWAICKTAPPSRQITTTAPHHSVFYRPDALPAAQPTASKHWRHNSAEALKRNTGLQRKINKKINLQKKRKLKTYNVIHDTTVNTQINHAMSALDTGCTFTSVQVDSAFHPL